MGRRASRSTTIHEPGASPYSLATPYIHDPTASVHNGEYLSVFARAVDRTSVPGFCRLRYRQPHHHHRDSHHGPYHYRRQFYRRSECSLLCISPTLPGPHAGLAGPRADLGLVR